MLISSNNHNELYMQTRIVTKNYSVAYMWYLTIYITLDFHKVWNTPEDL